MNAILILHMTGNTNGKGNVSEFDTSRERKMIMEINIAMAISFTVGMLLGGVGGALIIRILVGGNLRRVKNERVQNVVYRKKII